MIEGSLSMKSKTCACALPYCDRRDCECECHDRRTLICDKCGAENWNLASEGKPHDQPANEVKGYDACDGVWRRPGKVIPFPKGKMKEGAG